MACKNDKWVMFRNYMHNELGITKEDIQEWIQDAIKIEVKNVVANAYGKCNIEGLIRKEIYGDNFIGEKTLRNTVKDAVAKVLCERIELNVNVK